jgi:hypothetical protein
MGGKKGADRNVITNKWDRERRNYCRKQKIIFLHEAVQYELSENQSKLQTKSLKLLKPTGYVMHQQD